jgi:hypothetical protein
MPVRPDNGVFRKYRVGSCARVSSSCASITVTKGRGCRGGVEEGVGKVIYLYIINRI